MIPVVLHIKSGRTILCQSGRENQEKRTRSAAGLHIMRWEWPRARPSLRNNLSGGAKQHRSLARSLAAVRSKASRCRILRFWRRSSSSRIWSEEETESQLDETVNWSHSQSIGLMTFDLATVTYRETRESSSCSRWIPCDYLSPSLGWWNFYHLPGQYVLTRTVTQTNDGFCPLKKKKKKPLRNKRKTQ